MNRLVLRCLKYLNKAEDWFLITMLAVMVVLAIAQIFYRNFFGAGVVWIDPLLRALVLWVAIFGAVIASRTNNHIRIDFFTRYFSERTNAVIQRTVYAFCVIVCSTIAWHGLRFVQMEYEVSTTAFSSVPAWATQVVIPLGFFLIALHYLLLFITPAGLRKH